MKMLYKLLLNKAAACIREVQIQLNKFEEIVCNYEGHELYGYYQLNKSKNNLILVPGSYTHHSIWKPVIENANIDANILLVELPGFGKSKPRMPDGTIEEFALLILKLIEGAGINRFYIGGHSIGGMIAIDMMDHARDKIDGVISCEGWTDASVEEDAFKKMKNETLTEENKKLRSYYGTIGRTNWSDDEISLYSKIWRKWEKGRSLLERAEMPILQIWGDRGMAERPGLDKLQIPDRENIRLVWIKNCGHSMLVQYPELIGKEIAEFIRKKGRYGSDLL